MRSAGLDTSVLVRLLTGEPEDQANQAHAYVRRCFASGVRLHVNDLVVAESYHALIYHYDVPKPEAVNALLKLLESPLIQSNGYAVAILRSYTGKGVGFVDRLIRAQLLEYAERVITLDHDFSKLDDVDLLR